MGVEVLIKVLVQCYSVLVEIIYLPIIFLRNFKTPKKCPPVKNKLLLLSAAEVARRIRKKQITSVEIVQAYISRIKEVNPLINAVVEDRFQEALDDAQKADDFVQNSGLSEDEIEKKHPLLGVPVTVKGSVAVTGMDHRTGRVDCQRRAKSDACAVKNAKDSGGVILLISNTPELCLNWETVNKLTGATSNPYDTTRTPGGSSGGEASLLGCGASLIGIGSDIAGSLRLPAHCCGVWGHKPSPHVVSSVGHYPDCSHKDVWDKVFTLGPMARYATDLKLLLSVIAEPQTEKILQLERPTDVKKIKVYYMDDPRSDLADRFDKDVMAAFEKVKSHFDEICDSKCTKVELPLMKYCSELSYLRMMSITGIDSIMDNKENGLFVELLKCFIGQSDHELVSISFEILQSLVPAVFGKSMKTINKATEQLRDDFIRILGDDGVFILPTSPREATYKGDVFRRLFNGGCLSIFNSLGFPATGCPVMFSANGLPIGIQVVAGPNMDRLNFCVAAEIERAFGGWKFD